jgi:hypothetical protein
VNGRALARAVSCRIPTTAAPRSGHVGFVVDKVALGQVFSEYFLSSEAGTIGQLVADVSSGHSLTPPRETLKKCKGVNKIRLAQDRGHWQALMNVMP